MTLLRTILVFLIFSVVPVAHADTLSDLMRDEQSLESELSLARKSGVYFMLNVREKKIYFKARGEVLKEIPVEKAVVWDCPVVTRVVNLHKKKALVEPERKEIKSNPGKSQDKFVVDALEMEDMPSNFNLALDNGILITVSPHGNSPLSKITAAWHYFAWYASRPLLTVWNYLQKRSFSSIYLTMDKSDAQSLYWSSYEGSHFIITYE